MKLDRDDYGCEWCACTFARRHARGRIPHYCSRTCRQRAYEARRRAAYVAGLPAAPIPTSPPTRTRRASYESGLREVVRHALRADGVPDRHGLRPTLCGARAVPLRPAFEPWLGGPIPGPHRYCRTCTAVAERFPPLAPLDPPADLARTRHLLGRLRAAVAGRADPAVVLPLVATVLATIEATAPPPVRGPRLATPAPGVQRVA